MPTVSVAVFIPERAKYEKVAREVMKDHVGVSDSMCHFDKGCTKRDTCTFRHSEGQNNVVLKRVAPLKKGCVDGFVHNGVARALVITFFLHDSSFVSYGFEEITTVLVLENAVDADTTALIESFVDPKRPFDHPRLEPAGCIDREYTRLRYFVECTLDTFSYHASILLSRKAPGRSVIGYPIKDTLETRFLLRSCPVSLEEVHAPVERTLAKYTHPLRDYACYYNLMQLLGKETLAKPTPQEMRRRNDINHTINLTNLGL